MPKTLEIRHLHHSLTPVSLVAASSTSGDKKFCAPGSQNKATAPCETSCGWMKDGEQGTLPEPWQMRSASGLWRRVGIVGWWRCCVLLSVCVGSRLSWKGEFGEVGWRFSLSAPEMESCATHQSICSPDCRWLIAWSDCGCLLMMQYFSGNR